MYKISHRVDFIHKIQVNNKPRFVINSFKYEMLGHTTFFGNGGSSETNIWKILF